MREEINRWKSSAKFLSLKEKLEKKNRLLMDKETLMNINYNNAAKLSKLELVTHIKAVMDFNKNPDGNIAYQSDVNSAVIHQDFYEIYNAYIKQQVFFHLQLFHSLIDEEYEIAAMLRDFISFLESEVIFLIETFREDISPSFKEKIVEVNKLHIDIVNNKVDDYNNANDSRNHK